MTVWERASLIVSDECVLHTSPASHVRQPTCQDPHQLPGNLHFKCQLHMLWRTTGVQDLLRVVQSAGGCAGGQDGAVLQAEMGEEDAVAHRCISAAWEEEEEEEEEDAASGDRLQQCGRSLEEMLAKQQRQAEAERRR